MINQIKSLQGQILLAKHEVKRCTNNLQAFNLLVILYKDNANLLCQYSSSAISERVELFQAQEKLNDLQQELLDLTNEELSE